MLRTRQLRNKQMPEVRHVRKCAVDWVRIKKPVLLLMRHVESSGPVVYSREQCTSPAIASWATSNTVSEEWSVTPRTTHSSDEIDVEVPCRSSHFTLQLCRSGSTRDELCRFYGLCCQYRPNEGSGSPPKWADTLILQYVCPIAFLVPLTRPGITIFT